MTVPRTPQDITDSARLIVIDLALVRYRAVEWECIETCRDSQAAWWSERVDALLEERHSITSAAEARSLAATIKA